MMLGGSSANTASWLRAMDNTSIELVGVVGNDQLGKTAKATLAERRVGTAFLQTLPAISTSSCIVLTGEHDRAFISANQANEQVDVDHLPIQHILSDSASLPPTLTSHLHFASFYCCSKLRGPKTTAVFDQLRKAGVTISLDPQLDSVDKWNYPELWEMLKSIDIFLPNETEAVRITEEPNEDKALEKLCRGMPHGLVVLKLGSKGAVAAKLKADGSGLNLVQVSAFQVQPIDTTGAGDGFNAGFLHLYAQKRPLAECLAFGCQIGGLCVTQVGAFTGKYTSLAQIQVATASFTRNQ